MVADIDEDPPPRKGGGLDRSVSAYTMQDLIDMAPEKDGKKKKKKGKHKKKPED